ncbi:hypothetical protein TTHERM_000431189 (macronuclear) [Tetrahymena thermophila SB210]|uniref:Uncharacterized protein n=1 Tax=Tetrahymena thermophila (strain SB210) TaxID=312017 RepID=W7X5E1_TETTS|nr:hypothetical protein TTHERM_000431189 [Tetrahymena thermophila SB210]EWS72617.1 hypothetical protein TTHERM_000431189 [Tetrahymena thermophila SB210]|eukprot:XP_012654900.1 hypothetical protein TTHERM_000431189 [Tetrahymena thermophila SB210]
MVFFKIQSQLKLLRNNRSKQSSTNQKTSKYQTHSNGLKKNLSKNLIDLLTILLIIRILLQKKILNQIVLITTLNINQLVNQQFFLHKLILSSFQLTNFFFLLLTQSNQNFTSFKAFESKLKGD